MSRAQLGGHLLCRLRPEAYASSVHNHLTGVAQYPIDASLLNWQAVSEVFSRYGTYLLLMAYPERLSYASCLPGRTRGSCGSVRHRAEAFFKSPS
jgi:hypothetical protein